MNEKSQVRTRWDCVYHVVWIPKYRRKALCRECRAEAGSIIRELAEKKTGREVVEGGVCSDRVRVCLKIPSKCAVPDAMGYLKDKNAPMLCDRHPEWRIRIGKDRALWSRACYVSTVGPNELTVKRYTGDQEE